jgi:hypothetical protein
MAGFDIVANVIVAGLDQLKRLGDLAKKAGDEASKAGEEVEGLGEKAKGAGEEFEGAGEKARGAGEEFDGAGGKSKGAGEEFDGAGKKAKGAGEKLEKAAQQFRAMGSAGTFAGDSLERFSIVTSGPMGAAIAGAVVAFAGLKVAIAAVQATVNGLTTSIRAYIETSAPLQKQQQTLNTQFKTLTATFGAAIVGGESFGKVMEVVGRIIDKVTDFIVENSGTILKFTKTFSSVAKVLIQIFLGIITGITAPMTGMADLIVFTINKLMGYFARVQMDILEMTMALPDAVKKAFGLTDAALAKEYASAQKRAAAGAKGAGDAFAKGFSAKLTQAVAEVNKATTDIDRAIQGLTPATGRATVAPPTTPTGGAPGDQVAPERIQTGLGFLAEAAIGRSLQIAELRKQNEKDFGEINALMDAYIRKANAIAAQTLRGEARARELDKISKATEELNKRLEAADQAAKDLAVGSLGQLGSSIMQTMGAFSVGASSLRDFGDAMADLAARIASDFGTLFIKLGAGFVITPGSQALGAGLIAAGLALQFISGAIGAKGSANAGGGGGRAAAASTDNTIAREVSRSLRPSGDDGPAVTNIEVVIGGRSIQPEMVGIIDDIVRQRRSRYLGRRAGI